MAARLDDVAVFRPFGAKEHWMKALWSVLAAMGMIVTMATASAAEVIVKKDGNEVSITGGNYRAAIDANGTLTLTVKDAPALVHVFGQPGKPPKDAPVINVTNNMVAVRDGNARVEWTFKDESISLLTEGYEFECRLDASVKAIVAPGGKGGPLGKYNGGTIAIVLGNDLGISFSKGMHTQGRRILPGGYTNGGLVKGGLFETELKLGTPADALQMLSGIRIAAVGNGVGNLNDGGNTGGNAGGGFIHFPHGAKIAFDTVQDNLSAQTIPVEYRLSVLDHYVAGKEVDGQKKVSTIEPNSSATSKWELPELAPGFYYLTVAAWRGETMLTESKQTFTVDLAAYKHEQTRPADFAEFWARQEQKLKDTPANPVVTEIAVKDFAGKAYDVTLDLPGGTQAHGVLVVPTNPGPGPAEFGSLIAKTLAAMVDNLKSGNYPPADPNGKRAEVHSVQFFVSLPSDATYTKWNSAEDNNMLECIVLYMRAVDFLATRPEVKPARILVNGASRSGPLAVIIAAQRPKNICGVSAFVHTSAGISWQDKPYIAWGIPSGHKADNPEQVKRLAAMAAYVDPVNHVSDVTCPIWFGYGVDDTLAQPQGIEAMYHLCPAAWKRISRNAGGHQYSDDMKKIAKELADLLSASGGPDQDATLKQH